MARRRRADDVDAGNVHWVEGDLDDPASLIPAVPGVSEVLLATPMHDSIAAREIAHLKASGLR